MKKNVYTIGLIFSLVFSMFITSCGNVAVGNASQAWVDALAGAVNASKGVPLTGLAQNGRLITFIFPSSGGMVAATIDYGAKNYVDMFQTFKQAVFPGATTGDVITVLTSMGWKQIQPWELPDEVLIALSAADSWIKFVLVRMPVLIVYFNPIGNGALPQCSEWNPCNQ